MKILIIDDDDMIQKSISHVLSPNKHELLFAKNGDNAIDVLDDNRDVDLIICDIMMPEISGPTFILMLKRFFIRALPSLVVISNVKDGEAFLNKLDIKYDYFLNKPLDYKALEQIVAQIENKL
jgi:CheY-like chemotaxis protein